MLEDGKYDVVVIDATSEEQRLHVDLTIIAGPHKGEVLSVRGEGVAPASDPASLLGLAATLVVEGGTPRLQLEP